MTIAIVVVAGVIMFWLVLRHGVLALMRGRRVILTSRVGAILVMGIATVVAALSDGAALIFGLLVGGFLIAAAIYASGVWMVFGTDADFILDRAQFVARGLLMKPERTDHLLIAGPPPGARVAVKGGLLGARAIRISAPRASKKSLLFLQGLEKLLGPKRQGGRS